MNEPANKNIVKGESYRYAIDRMHQAIREEYFLEAITLCESIVTDRIYSVCHGRRAKKLRGANKETLGGVLDKWTPRDEEETNLHYRVNAWREKRNAALHGACRSEPLTPTKPTHEFLVQARQAADEGLELVNDVKTWQRRVKPKPIVFQS